MQETDGQFLPLLMILGGALVGGVSYLVNMEKNNLPITIPGMTIAVGGGAIGGSYKAVGLLTKSLYEATPLTLSYIRAHSLLATGSSQTIAQQISTQQLLR